MSTDSQETFSTSTKAHLRHLYHCNCAICLLKLGEESAQHVHILERGESGGNQIAHAKKLGVLPPGYSRTDATNGLVQCPTCYLGLFASNYVALSPPLEVLQYILDYVKDPDQDIKPLHEVFNLLDIAAGGSPVDLLDVDPILPFLGLYSLVVLMPSKTKGIRTMTPHMPNLSILDGRYFVPAPPDTLPNTPGATRIFDVLGMDPDPGLVLGHIPVDPSLSNSSERLLWRLPVSLGVVFSVLMERVSLAERIPSHPEVALATAIQELLHSSSWGYQDTLPSLHASGGLAAGRPSGDGSEPPADGSGTLDDGASGGHPRGTKRPFVDSNCEEEDQDSNINEEDVDFSAVSQSPSDGGKPEEWAFGPEYSTNRIVFAATGRVLV